ncbi:matrixin family metalloprotease, partial [Microvirga makkahensis]
MPAVATYSPTGNAYIDGLLGDVKWAVNSFTFSIPTSGGYYGSSYGDGENITNFGVLNSGQQTATRGALKMFASVANLSFTEISETSSQHADLRFAMSDKPSTAWAYFPTAAAEGGDAWFNNSDGYYNTPVKGNYASLTFVHEIGHAFGLEHPHENGMPSSRDSMEYTVMSYRSYVGASTTSGYVNETWGYAQSLMMYDIAAL